MDVIAVMLAAVFIALGGILAWSGIIAPELRDWQKKQITSRQAMGVIAVWTLIVLAAVIWVEYRVLTLLSGV